MAGRWPNAHQFCTTGTFVWNTRELLGRGATGAVFVGYNKKSGERVAVKVFTGGLHMKAVSREMDAVNRLPPHNNIVKLICVEEERSTRSQVIIMELCTNGSLFDVITAPENAYGLCETEFKQVIYDVAKGMQHLHLNKYIHKDIKPGNIMRCQKPDGSFTFKLADFGTARELDPEEQGFFSIDGTEEYLWPGMYDSALINPGERKKQFSAKIDLWSVGATFFHAATGRLPFQPFRKREDKHLMYQIISEKPTGMVSGWQVEHGGKVIYSNKLPNDIRLSTGMADLTTEVLAGLMETDISKMWDFDKFFKQIERIQRMKVVDVFCVATCTCHKIFIDPDNQDGVQRLKEGIQAQTSVAIDHQQLFFSNIPYRPTEPVLGAKLPVTMADQPMMVFGGNSKPGFDLPVPPLPPIPSAPQSLSLEKDLQYAKDCSKVVYYFKYQVEQLERVHRLTHQAALCYCYTVREDCSVLEQRLASIDQLNKVTCRVLSSQLTRLTGINETVSAVNQVTPGKYQTDIQTLKDIIRTKEDELNKVSEEPNMLRTKMESIKQDLASTGDHWESKMGADVFHKSNETIQYMVVIVAKDFKTLQKENSKHIHKPLDALEQKLHRFTKTRLQGIISEAHEKVGSLLSARTQVHTCLSDWLLKMIPLRSDVEEIGKRINLHSSECNAILQQADQWESEHRTILEAVNQKIATSHSNQPEKPQPKPQADLVEIPLHLLARLKQSRNDLSTAVGQQKEIINQLSSLPSNTNSPQN